MTQIFKYPIEVTDVQRVELPVSAKILTVQFQHDKLCLWARVECGDTTKETRTIEVFGTGHTMLDTSGPRLIERNYIGTVQQHGGILVWHVFERV